MLKPSTCAGCPLVDISQSFSQPEGQGKTGVLIIGEALGFEENIDGLPFRPKAQAGSKLEECIKSAGYTRSDFRLWNIIACQPPGNKLVGQWYEGRAIDSCKQYLKKVVEGLEVKENAKRKVILALGNTAFKNLTGNNSSVLDVMGYCFPSKIGLFPEIYTVIASLHPSYIKRGNAHLTPLLTEHIRKAVEIAGQEEEMEWRIEDMTRDPNGYIPKDPNNPIPVGEDDSDNSIPF